MSFRLVLYIYIPEGSDAEGVIAPSGVWLEESAGVLVGEPTGGVPDVGGPLAAASPWHEYKFSNKINVLYIWFNKQ